jgi:hypothetical protein
MHPVHIRNSLAGARKRSPLRMAAIPRIVQRYPVYEAIRLRFLRSAGAYIRAGSPGLRSGLVAAHWPGSHGCGRGCAYSMAKVAKAAHQRFTSGEAHAALYFTKVRRVVAQEPRAHGCGRGHAHVMAKVAKAAHPRFTSGEAYAALYFSQVRRVVAQEPCAHGCGRGQLTLDSEAEDGYLRLRVRCYVEGY